ncbi:hypothetical protein C8Q78DRAFT_1078703 [Trametes maxima]|nr:hypothetical protein C8Q78DRAFT_1078703 [Trametes maxima]
MADARALLRAKRQEARIDHPLAAYTSSGQLRCIACGTPVKHAAAWEGHIGSKAHRTSAARLRDERARESLKRKAAEQDENSDGGNDEGVGAGGVGAEAEGDDGAIATQGHAKRQRTAESTEEPQPRPAAAASTRSALPADFFSDPSQAPAAPEADSDADEDMDVDRGTDKDKDKDKDGNPRGGQAAGSDALDLEWQQFQESVVNAPDVRETYERATVFAEPVLAEEVPQGFPGSTAEAGENAEAEVAEELDEEGQRRKKEQEERELIMDRLLEEEQAQEEADARVVQLKTKLEALRQKREAARAAKKGAKAS